MHPDMLYLNLMLTHVCQAWGTMGYQQMLGYQAKDLWSPLYDVMTIPLQTRGKVHGAPIVQTNSMAHVEFSCIVLITVS